MLDEELRQGSVVVEAWGAWCGNCRRLRPLVAEVASASHAALVEVDVDRAPELVDELSIRSVPTLVALHDGVEVGRLVGVQSPDAVQGLFDAARDGDPATVRSGVPGSLLSARAAAGVALLLAALVFGSVPLAIVGAIVLVWALTGVLRR
jgi:thioredoxin-like negative regulator of GroEL